MNPQLSMDILQAFLILADHFNVHTNKFQCEGCKKSFGRKRYLETHLKGPSINDVCKISGIRPPLPWFTIGSESSTEPCLFLGHHPTHQLWIILKACPSAPIGPHEGGDDDDREGQSYTIPRQRQQYQVEKTSILQYCTAVFIQLCVMLIGRNCCYLLP